MDGENNGKPYLLMDDLGGKLPPIFGNIHLWQLPGIPTTIKTMGVNITTIAYLRGLIIEIGSTILLLVVEAQGTG